MTQNPKPVELKKPLTLWQKVKTGAKGFVKTAVITCRAACYSQARSSAAWRCSARRPATAIRWGWAQASAGEIGGLVARNMILGGLISGTVGAVSSVRQATKLRHNEIEAQADELKRCRSCGPERSRNTHRNSYRKIICLWALIAHRLTEVNKGESHGHCLITILPAGA